MIAEDYVSFETAKLLKEKGFNETCRAFWKEWNSELHLCACSSAHVFEFCHNSMLEQYNDNEELNISAPTLQMAMKWLREVHNLFIGIEYVNIAGLGFTYQAIISKLNDYYDYCICKKSYEDAIEAAIKHCLKNLI